MRRYALLVAFFAGACADGGSLDARMKPMVGASEPALVAAMGRAPDVASQTADGARLLQWRWQKDYASADPMLGYSYAGGVIKPIPNTSRCAMPAWRSGRSRTESPRAIAGRATTARR